MIGYHIVLNFFVGPRDTTVLAKVLCPRVSEIALQITASVTRVVKQVPVERTITSLDLA